MKFSVLANPQLLGSLSGGEYTPHGGFSAFLQSTKHQTLPPALVIVNHMRPAINESIV